MLSWKSIIVHRYRPLADGRLRVRWLPASIVEGNEVLGEGAAKENVKAGQIVSIIELNDGVVSHAASRKLDNAVWRYGETELALDDLTREADRIMFAKLEEWVVATKGTPIKRTCNSSTSGSQKWLRGGCVDFAEIFCGAKGITFAVEGCRMRAAAGFDKRLVSYGRSWNLQDSYEQ